jgi:hypothetical protein
MAYATLAELRAYVGIPVADTADDTNLTLALDSASAQVDAYCGRSFTIDAAVVARSYTPSSDTGVDIDPVATLTGLVVETDDDDNGTFETTWTVGTDFRVEPANAAALAVPWTRLVAVGAKVFPTSNRYFPGLRVTAKYGWPGAPPSPVKQATLILAVKLFKRKDAPFGVAGTAEYGSEMRILPGDLDAERLLNPYRRSWVVV